MRSVMIMTMVIMMMMEVIMMMRMLLLTVMSMVIMMMMMMIMMMMMVVLVMMTPELLGVRFRVRRALRMAESSRGQTEPSVSSVLNVDTISSQGV